MFNGGSQIKQQGTHQVQNTHDLLCCKKTVGDQSNKKRRDHGSNGQCTVGSTYLNAGSVQVLNHISAHGNIPGTPDEIFEKHHRGQ